MKAEEFITAVQNALFQWYAFPADAEIYTFDKNTVSDQKGKKFDYILSKADLETYEDPQKFFNICKPLLKKNGRLLLAVNNRFGIRYFCGNKDMYTQRCFDGIEGYVRIYAEEKADFIGRTYTKAELKKILKKAGIFREQFFSVFSDLENPVLIYREDFLPNEDMMARISPSYSDATTIFIEEELLYKSLIENNMFHTMANAYIMECAFDEDVELSDVQHVTSSAERSKENAMFTIVHDTGIVEKSAMYEEGQNRLKVLFENGEDLKKNGIKIVPAGYQNGRYQMPFVQYENGHLYLKRLLEENPEAFLEKLDLFKDTILKSSRTIREDMQDGEGAILEYGYCDMVPLNSFFDGTDFVFYDQELKEENLPANVMLFRMIATLYYNDARMRKWMPMEVLLQRYGLDTKLEKWRNLEAVILDELRNDSLLEIYHKNIRANHNGIRENADKITYSIESYESIYINIFEKLENKKLILFGTGVYAERFWKYCSEKYPVYGVVDNQKEKWGTSWHDIQINSPEWLYSLASNEFKVMICTASYKAIIRQLESMKIKDYGVFDVQKLSSFLLKE